MLRPGTSRPPGTGRRGPSRPPPAPSAFRAHPDVLRLSAADHAPPARGTAVAVDGVGVAAARCDRRSRPVGMTPDHAALWEIEALLAGAAATRGCWCRPLG
ncbi:hypothetical protein GCM10010521_42470 [Streptomyces rameus]|uniref:Uncharacterized protein n=1 Tax=Streptomyces rameus TaxID=68261 RepID=A0ABP6NJN3_9ACTN